MAINKIQFFLLIVSVLAMYNCSPVSIITNGYDEADLSVYETYGYFDLTYERYDSGSYDAENIELMRSLINENMERKSFRLSENPDLLLNIGIVIKQQAQIRETDPSYDMNYVGQRNYHWEREEKVVGIYEEGALTIDFVDTDTNKLVWQGTATGILSAREKKMNKRVNAAIEGIFKELNRQ